MSCAHVVGQARCFVRLGDNLQRRNHFRPYVARQQRQNVATVDRMARWVDFDNDYKTMDRDFMESVWWVFKQLWDKGLIYEGLKVVPYSWRISTPLSNF